MSEQILDKLYFKVGEVSEIANVPSYVLRFWETEFPDIKPKRTPSGQRLYRKADVETILRIKKLLYEKKFTIIGAKIYLKNNPEKNTKTESILLKEIADELREIRDMLN